MVANVTRMDHSSATVSLPTRSLLLSALLAIGLPGCVEDTRSGDTSINPGGKEDSGWVGADTFEVETRVRSTVQQKAAYEWAELATDPELQAKLVDLQIKFIKNSAESYGWRFNQLAGDVVVKSVDTEDDLVTIEYEATGDMLGRYSGRLPELEDIDPLEFSASVPMAPTGFSYGDMRACSEVDESHSVASYNIHYYFAPHREGCTLPLFDAAVEIVEVFNRPTVYPEYDQLVQDLGEGRVGFTAALVPNRGDEDPMSRYDVHADMLERNLDLEGVLAEDETYTRYTWDDGAVRLIIDLYDPTKIPWTDDFASAFRARLGEYTLVHYNGHSSYGSKHLLDHPESFSDSYQIIVMHSCQSYAYYARQVFRAKATEEDPSGFALADVVATGKSSYPSGSPPVMRVLLESLMEGMVSIQEGSPANARSWMDIARAVNYATWGDIMYGIAGARTNTWQPE